MINKMPKEVIFAEERKRIILQLLEKNERISPVIRPDKNINGIKCRNETGI